MLHAESAIVEQRVKFITGKIFPDDMQHVDRASGQHRRSVGDQDRLVILVRNLAVASMANTSGGMSLISLNINVLPGQNGVSFLRIITGMTAFSPNTEMQSAHLFSSQCPVEGGGSTGH